MQATMQDMLGPGVPPISITWALNMLILLMPYRFGWRMFCHSIKLASRRSLPFMPPGNLLPRSQHPPTGSCSESDESSSRFRVVSLRSVFNIIPSFTLGLLRGLCPLSVPSNVSCHFSLSAYCPVCP